jgi:hypothetical protein
MPGCLLGGYLLRCFTTLDVSQTTHQEDKQQSSLSVVPGCEPRKDPAANMHLAEAPLRRQIRTFLSRSIPSMANISLGEDRITQPSILHAIQLHSKLDNTNLAGQHFPRYVLGTPNMRLFRPTCLHETEHSGEIGNDVLFGSIVAGKHHQLESPSRPGTMFANFPKKIHPHRTTSQARFAHESITLSHSFSDQSRTSTRKLFSHGTPRRDTSISS